MEYFYERIKLYPPLIFGLFVHIFYSLGCVIFFNVHELKIYIHFNNTVILLVTDLNLIQ